MPSLSALLLALVAFAIGGMQLASARWIREEESTHPAYKLEKVVWGAVYLGSGAVTLIAEPARTPFRFFTGLLLIGSTVIATIFIRYRRDNPLYRVIRLRTQMGARTSGTMRENNRVVSQAAALLRHHRTGGGQRLMSDWALTELLDAVGLPASDEWVAREREALRQRREAQAGDGEGAPGRRGIE